MTKEENKLSDLLPVQLEALHRIGRLATALNSALEKPGMSIRNISAFTGVDKSTVFRAKQQQPISAEAFLALEIWLEAAGPLLTGLRALSLRASAGGEDTPNWTECCNMSPEGCDCANPKHIRVSFAAPSPLPAPVVRELEWEPKGGTHGVYADCGFDDIYFAYDDGEWSFATKHHQSGGTSLAEAKAAAQADYTARILSALHPAVPDVSEAARDVGAARRHALQAQEGSE